MSAPDMLRITVTEIACGQRWILQGSLTKNSASELLTHWSAARNQVIARVVDVSEITSIDKAGEEVLSLMIRDGAKFISSGVYTTYLLEKLKSKLC